MKDLSDEVEGVHGSSEEYWQDDAWRCDQGLCGELPTSGRELHNSPGRGTPAARAVAHITPELWSENE